MIEDLAPCVPAGQLFERHAGDPAHCAEILDRTVPVFVRVFRAGCNHIDVNPGAILLDERDRTKTFLLDFEHAVFRRAPSLEVLAFEAGYFAGFCRDWVKEDVIDGWFARLLEAIGVADPAQARAATERFHHYRNQTLSRRERRKIR